MGPFHGKGLSCLRRWLWVGVLSLVPAVAATEEVTVGFLARIVEIRSSGATLPDRLARGDPITGVYTIDAATKDRELSRTLGVYPHARTGQGFRLLLGDAEILSLADREPFTVEVSNPSTLESPDTWELTSTANTDLVPRTTTVRGVQLRFVNARGTALRSDRLPTGVPDLRSWDDPVVLTVAGSLTDQIRATFVITAHVESFFTPRVSTQKTGPLFIRGDADSSGVIDISDAISTLGHLFLGQKAPPCMKSADGNDDGNVDISDAVYSLSFLFLGGAAFPAPQGGCGTDPTADSLSCSSPPACVVPTGGGAEEAVTRLTEESATPPRITMGRGLPKHISLQVEAPAGADEDPVGGALTFLRDYKGLFGLQQPETQLSAKKVVQDGNEHHVVFEQSIGGVPVFDSEISVHYDGDLITAVAGEYLSEVPAFGKPSISVESAITRARLSERDELLESRGTPRLVYFDAAQTTGGSAGVRLAWRLSLWGPYSNRVFLVDAFTGDVLLSQDLEIFESPDKDFDIETANHTRSSSCWNLPWEWDDDEWFDEDGPTGYPGNDTDGQNAFDFAHLVYDWYYDQFGRRSWDGDDEQVEVMVHVGRDFKNAYYSPSCDHVAFGDSYVVRDIFAHEYTHAVTYWSSELKYRDQSGALSESLSDTFAAFVDGNWTIGENLPKGTIRDMSDPPVKGDPDHMDPAISGDGIGLRPPPAESKRDKSNDYGWVHTNCGILNKVAYLITVGGAHHGVDITGIGLARARRLYFDVMTKRITKSTDFLGFRRHVVDQAWSYVNNGNQYNFFSYHICEIINAFGSVGIGDLDTDCDGIPDPSDADVDNDNIPNGADNCVDRWNIDQADNDSDGLGDRCDPDDDNDGVPDEEDNCPNVTNPSQRDDDGDGIGEHCDDSDYDNVPNALDNCLHTYNPDQRDDNRNGYGDACEPDRDFDGVLNVNDNCPDHSNWRQTDTDGDGVGDTCDNCDLTENSIQIDRDDDGLGDGCDDDMDGDGVPNDEDNCPYHPNPDQLDFDHNGKGFVCDEGVIVSFHRDVVDRIHRGMVRFLDPRDPATIPISPCGDSSCPEGPDVLRSDFLQTEISVEVAGGSWVVLANDDGSTFRRPDDSFVVPGRKTVHVFRFTAEPRMYFRSEAVGTLESRGIAIQVYPPTQDVDPSVEYPITVQISGGGTTER